MPNRRLTKKQRQQIAYRQFSKLKPNDIISHDGLQININNRFEALVIANYGVDLEVRSKQNLSEPIYCRKRSNIVAPIAGDIVIVEQSVQDSFVVVAVKPRGTVLEKLAFSNKLKPVAANVTKVFLVLAVVPEPNFYILDKYIVTIKHYNIDLVIVLNKIDLNKNDERCRKIIKKINYYRSVGYKTICTSTVACPLISNLITIVRGNTCVFVGDSGVGKSSLVNTILSTKENKTSHLSGNKGVHTTSVAKLLFVDGSSYVIDTPGVRELSTRFLTEPDVVSGFAELQDYMGLCKYRNCNHQNSSVGCALQQAKERGNISSERLQNYLTIIEELNQNKK